MISPELAASISQAEQEQEQVLAAYTKVEIDSKELAAAVERAGVALDEKAKAVIAEGKILAAYRSETANKASILVAVGERVVVIVVENFPISKSQLYSGAELLQHDGQGVWATNTGGYVKHNPALSAERDTAIAQFDAQINNPTTSDEVKAELRKKRDAYITGQSPEASVQPNPEHIFAQIEKEFYAVKGGDLNPVLLERIRGRKKGSKRE